MSERKTFLAGEMQIPFDIAGLSATDRHDVEKSLEFTVGQRLLAVKEHAGQDRFVQLCGKSWKQVSRYLRGDAPPLSVLQSISQEILVSIEWLVRGQITTAADKRLEERLLRTERGNRIVLANSPKPEPIWSMIAYGIDIIEERLALLSLIHVRELPPPRGEQKAEGPLDTANLRTKSGMITILRYDEVRPSAGPGSTAISEASTTRMAFEVNWLADLGVKSESAVILPAQGDSMEPTIMNGAPMLVDTSKREVRNGFIYVFDVAGDLMVKRIERLPDGTINLLSDNSAKYPSRNLDRESAAQMTVIGRVYAAVSKF